MRLITLSVFAICSLTILAVPPKVIKEFTGKVTKVLDGDSVELKAEEKTLVIRLEGIDAPEPSQNFGSKAKEILSSLVLDKTVTIKQTGDDMYGRIIGYMILEQTEINLKMVEEGWAWHFSKYNDEERYSKLEKLALKEKKGLWADEQTPIAPWDYRAKKKTPEGKKDSAPK